MKRYKGQIVSNVLGAIVSLTIGSLWDLFKKWKNKKDNDG